MARLPLTDFQQKEIRKWYFVRQQGACRHSDVVSWFTRTHSRKINQSQVSKILSKSYSYLDTTTAKHELKRKRRKECDWPVLERALSQWQLLMQEKSATLSGEHLRQQATIFWSRLPQYNSITLPAFSSGWLSNFKQRHGIRGYRRHGEAG